MESQIERVAKAQALVPFLTLYLEDRTGVVNFEGTVNHAIAVLNQGADGGVVCGTTGRGHLLMHDVKINVIRMVGRAKESGRIDPEKVLLAGTGTSDLSEACRIAEVADFHGFDGLLVLPPKDCLPSDVRAFYHGLLKRCKQLQTQNPMVVILYHHPMLHHDYTISYQLYSELLLEYGAMIAGVKDSSAKETVLSSWSLVDGSRVIVGSDKLIGKALEMGWANGAIAGTANTDKGLYWLRSIFDSFNASNKRGVTVSQVGLTQEVGYMLEGGQEQFINNVTLNRLGTVKEG